MAASFFRERKAPNIGEPLEEENLRTAISKCFKRLGAVFNLKMDTEPAFEI
jgi:hypothetical protein